jgi:CHAT domain-containing protein
MIRRALPAFGLPIACLIAAALAASPGLAKPAVPSLADSFRIGSSGVVCTAERRSEDGEYRSIFDRAYDVVCRDAAAPVGRLYVLAGADRLEPAALPGLAGTGSTCAALPVARNVHGLPLRRLDCRDGASGLARTVYVLGRGGRTYAASGYDAYDAALVLGLASLVGDAPATGEIAVAVTGADDPAALARVQAASLDPQQALAAGYARANEGNHADASEYFDRLVLRARAGERGAERPAEYLANLAIEQSVLGNSAEAERLFAEATRASAGGDPMFPRLYRNLTAMHRLNLGDAAGARTVLEAPLAGVGADIAYRPERVAAGYIDLPISQNFAALESSRRQVWGGALPLSDTERATLLDAQGAFLHGQALLGSGDRAGARRDFELAQARFAGVRGGQVVSMAWLPADVALGLAGIAEADGNTNAAEAQMRRAASLIGDYAPGSAASLAVRGRLAATLARNGNTEGALQLYRTLVAEAPAVPGGSTALRGQIGPYLGVLAGRGKSADSARDFLMAAQTLVRPGVAQTQAVLARELSEGTGEAAHLFRQSLNHAREIVALDQRIAGFAAGEGTTQAELDALAASRARRQLLASEQTAIQARLAAFPRYRAVSTTTATLADLTGALKPGEAYYKLVIAGDAAYAAWVRPEGSRVFRIEATAGELEKLVNTVRDSIVVTEGNQTVTNPFDLAASWRLYRTLFGPVQGEVGQVSHIVFEPDGPLLKLPAGVLVTDGAAVEAYAARQQRANADAFDFRGVAWLARNHVVTTAVSVRSFLDVRAIRASTAPKRYLGLGENTVPAKSAYAPPKGSRDPCDWPLATWKRPVSSAELTLAAGLMGGSGNAVITGDAFNDTALQGRGDLADYRVIQFATHGLVTAPRPGCPARPALVTSFGPAPSDGLLSFKEIFALRLNADTVVLSACDTAGAATIEATRDAGVATGGNFALDGLVRAFVGAGARSVIASHWPVPDDFDATNRLMSGMFRSASTVAVGEALRTAQVRLMDDPLTSHPYYWGAFAVVGDATKPLTGG